MIKSKLLLQSLDGACNAKADESITRERKKYCTNRKDGACLWLVSAQSSKYAQELTGLVLSDPNTTNRA